MKQQSGAETIEAGAERHEFKAEVSRLLELMVGAVYSDRDVFLRELISNAADACERLRYEALERPDLIAGEPAFRITIRIDKPQDTLAVEDNGIGMSRDEMADNLGTIARSGTRAFMERFSEQGGAKTLIGQFGIGFYSAFMVASEVEVTSRRAGSEEAWRWRSDGRGAFTLEPVPLGEAPARGTRIRLHVKEDAERYLEARTLEEIVETHSAHVPVPIVLDEGKGAVKELSQGGALWRKPRAEITPEDYTAFYRHIAGAFDSPALTVHMRAEGRHDYTLLAYVPEARPIEIFDPERRSRMRLYVRRVFITDEAEILPPYLRFVRGLVDSEDLPLNISREMLQSTPELAAIRRAATGRILSELQKLAEGEPEKYLQIWDAFGPVLKEGLYDDPERRDTLFEIARFRSTKGEGWRSLKDYVEDLRPNQTEIYYLAGEDLARLAQSPQLEGFKARGVEVLLLPDAVDSFWTSTALGFSGKPFRSITQGSVDLSAIPLLDGEEGPAADAAPSAKVATLAALFKQSLGEQVSDVRASARLSTSAVCLVAPDGGPDRRLERLLASHGRSSLRPPVLELNPGHPLVRRLAEDAANGGGAERLGDRARLLFDLARILDGDPPSEPAAFAKQIEQLLTQGLSSGR